MSESPRSEQLRDDTLATLSIASEMVHAMFQQLQARIAEQQTEIDRLRAFIRDREETVDGSVLGWDKTNTATTASDTSELTGLTRLG